MSAFHDDDDDAVIAHSHDVMARPRDALVQLYAGYAAERELGVGLQIAKSGGREDFRRAAQLLQKDRVYLTAADFVRDVRRHLRRSRTFVRRHWGEIRSVAKELLRRETLTGDELRAMLAAPPRGAPPHGETERKSSRRSGWLEPPPRRTP